MFRYVLHGEKTAADKRIRMEIEWHAQPDIVFIKCHLKLKTTFGSPNESATIQLFFRMQKSSTNAMCCWKNL